MFGMTAFSEAAFGEIKVSESIFLGTLPIIYFNSSTLTFPLRINEVSNFNLSLNEMTLLSLNINKLNELDLNINKLQDHELAINTIINMNKGR